MTKLPTLLPLALAASVTLAGCNSGKKEPSLSSDNRSERLQAVRRAQDKWGAQKRAKTADEEAIIGRWNHPWTSSNYLLLNADGTFQRVALLGSVAGTYRVLPNDVIEMDYQGILGRWEFKYHLIGDTLDLQDGNFITYKRGRP